MVDTTAPTQTVVILAPVADGFTNDNTPTLAGTISTTLSAGEVVAVYRDATRIGVATVTSGTNWTYTDSAVGDGVHSYVARVEDLAGNQGAASATRFTVDTAAPAAPGTPDLSAASDAGVSPTDNITSVTTPTLTGGGAEAGATVTLYDTGGTTALGSAIADGSGNWSITSTTLAAGTHSLTVNQRDAALNQGAASSALAVFIDTTAPTQGENAALTLNENAVATITSTVLDFNDADSTEAQIIYKVTTAATHGTLRLNGVALNLNDTFSQADINGSLVTYTQDGSESPTGSFGFSVTDAAGNTVTNRTFTFAVTAVNDPVTSSAPASETLAEDTPSAITGLSIADADATLAPDGIYEVTLASTHGTLTLTTLTGLAFTAGDGTSDATMTFHGTLLDINTALATANYAPAVNYHGSAQVSISVTDQFGGIVATGSGVATSDSDNVSVTVMAVNDAPVNTTPVAQSVAEDTGLVFSSANGNAITVSDVDVGETASDDTLRVTLSVASGTLTLAGTAGLTFGAGDGTADTTMTFTGTAGAINTALDGLTYRGTLNFNGGDSLSIVTDDLGRTGADPGGSGTGDLTSELDSDTVGITVTAVNDAPTLTALGVVDTVNEDTQVEITFAEIAAQANEADVDGTVTAFVVKTVTRGTLLIGATPGGATAFAVGSNDIVDATHRAYWTGDLNENGTLGAFTVVARDDGTPGLESATPVAVQLSVTPVNDAPSFAVGAGQTVDEDAGAQTVAGFAGGFDGGPADEDGSQAVNSYVVSNDNNALFAVQPAIAADGTLSYTPAANAFGSATVTVQVRDSGGTANGGDDLSQPHTFTITVNPVNDPPQSGAVVLAAIAEDSGARVITQDELLSAVIDPDGPPAVARDLAITSGLGTLVDNGNGTWTYTPALNDDTQVSFSYVIDDGLASPVTASASLDITPVNDAPQSGAVVFAAIAEDSGPRVIRQDELLAGVSDPDGPPAVARDLAIVAGLGVLVDNGDGSWTYTPGANDDTQVSFSYMIDDGVAPPVTANASLDITPVNDAPVLHGVPAGAVFARDPVILAPGLTITDVDSATLASATVRVSAGAFAVHGDVLAVGAAGLAGTSIVANYDAATETLTLSGTDTLAHYQQALEHVTFQTTNFGNDRAQTITWQLDDGAAANELSALATTDIALRRPQSNDFSGNGHGGILWQNTDGTPAIWSVDGTRLITGANVGFNPGSDWHAIGSGDFNGDGKSDMLWQNKDGTIAEWFMDGTSLISGGSVAFNPGASWHAIGAGDFNGDGKADILWQNADGQAAVWLMDGLTILAGANAGFNPGAAWHIIDSGDFNGDGKSDILWQNNSGQAAVWLMDGTSLVSGSDVGANPGPSWNVQAAGDFNGDGKADILWQNDNGQAAVWLMDGTSLIAGADVGFNPGAAWQVHDAADFNGDGKADILWQNADGTPAVWLMDGLSVISGANVGFNPGSNWHVVLPHHDLMV